jgi:hypothetical protein
VHPLLSTPNCWGMSTKKLRVDVNCVWQALWLYRTEPGAIPADLPTECRVPAGAQALSGASTTRKLYALVDLVSARCFASCVYNPKVQWSKLRVSIRSLISAELRGRVDFHVTGYHRRLSKKVRSGEVTIDGEPVLRFSYDRFCKEGDGWFASARDSSGAIPSSAETVWCSEQRDEIHPPQQLGDAMRAYLDMQVQVALKSPNPLLRFLAIIDRRVGRRVLEELEIGGDEHTLVQKFYRLRMQAIQLNRE